MVVLVLLKLRNLFLGPAARDTDVSLNVIRTASVVTGIEPKPAPNPRLHPAGRGSIRALSRPDGRAGKLDAQAG